MSVRTIYRDVNHLGAAGVPVFAERGRNGGFALLGGFRTNLTGLTSSEADAVSLIGIAEAAADLGFGDEAASARLKILASLPPRAGTLATLVATRFHLDSSPWYARQAPPPALRELADAVWSDAQVCIEYESWKGNVWRTIAPLGLVMKAGAWYVAGAVGFAVRTYRVAAIRSLERTGEPIRRPREFDLAKYWLHSAIEFETKLRSETARVRLSPDGLRLLRDVNVMAADAATAQKPVPRRGGWVEVRIPFEHMPHAVREALRMGKDMEVLEPPVLRAAIAAEAGKIARRHERRRTTRR